MEENINDMIERHEKEIDALRSTCPHTHSKRLPYMWAPGHFSGVVLMCLDCGEKLE